MTNQLINHRLLIDVIDLFCLAVKALDNKTKVFLIECQINFAIALVLHCYALDWLISCHFLNQVKPKPNVTACTFPHALHALSRMHFPACTNLHALSRTWHRLHVFATSFDLFIRLSASVVTGQSVYYYYYYYVEFSTGIFPGEKYPVKSHPKTSDFQHFSEDMCRSEDIIIIIR